MKKILFTTLMLLFFGSISLSASTYYVSATGDNGNSGTFGDPWKTIQHE